MTSTALPPPTSVYNAPENKTPEQLCTELRERLSAGAFYVEHESGEAWRAETRGTHAALVPLVAAQLCGASQLSMLVQSPAARHSGKTRAAAMLAATWVSANNPFGVSPQNDNGAQRLALLFPTQHTASQCAAYALAELAQRGIFFCLRVDSEIGDYGRYVRVTNTLSRQSVAFVGADSEAYGVIGLGNADIVVAEHADTFPPEQRAQLLSRAVPRVAWTSDAPLPVA